MVEAVHDADEHISTEEVFALVKKQYPYANISTVYRTLELLEELGLVTKTDFGEGCVRYHHAEKGHHHHLVCQRCGVTIDLDEAELLLLQETLMKKHRFKADLRHMAIFGLCADCQTGKKIEKETGPEKQECHCEGHSSEAI